MTGYAIVAGRGLGGAATSYGIDRIVAPFEAGAEHFWKGSYSAMGRQIEALKDYEGKVFVIGNSLAGSEVLRHGGNLKDGYLFSIDPARKTFNGVVEHVSPVTEDRHWNFYQPTDTINDFGPVKGAQNTLIKDASHVGLDDHWRVREAIQSKITELIGETAEPPQENETLPEGVTMFDHWTPIFMKLLMEDFNVSEEDAAAVFGNAGHESAGYETLQEIKPIVEGSRGGFGIMQWTGPRRRSFEAYCERNGYNTADMMANYKWLFVELKGPEGRVLPRLRAAKTLNQKTKVFSDTFLRPGIPHMASRYTWAARAMSAWKKQPQTLPEIVRPGIGSEIEQIEAHIRSQLPDIDPVALDTIKGLLVMRNFGRETTNFINPQTPALPGKVNDMAFVESKPFYKSKTILGLIGVAVSVFVPQLAPVVDILTPSDASLPPEAIDATRDSVETIVTSISNILAAASILFASYGRKTAQTNLE